MSGLGEFIPPAASAVVAVGVLGGAWLKYGRPKWRRFTSKLDAGFESIVGRDAIIDKASGREKAPAVPGIGVRMASVEDSLAILVSSQKRLDDHDHRIGKLEEAAVERIVTRADSALAWRAIRAVAENGGPDSVGDAMHDTDEADDYIDETTEGPPGEHPRA